MTAASASGVPGTPAAAVVIPVGSVDGQLARQVRAVLGQRTAFDFEVILSVNSLSDADGTAVGEVVQATGDPRLRQVFSGDRRGAAHARNVGARATMAPRLAFCDADDEAREGWLAAIVGGLDAWDAVTGHTNELAPSGQESWRPPATPGRLPTFLGVPYVLSGNLAIRREALLAVGGFDETLTRCEDIALGWALLERGYRIGYVPEAVLDYRHRAGLRAFVRQHYLYGQGMAEVLSRYPLPRSGSTKRPTGLALMRPNAQPAPMTLVTLLRRASLAAGRAVGALRERRRSRAG